MGPSVQRPTGRLAKEIDAVNGKTIRVADEDLLTLWTQPLPSASAQSFTMKTQRTSHLVRRCMPMWLP